MCGVKVLRFWNSQLKPDKEMIRETIFRELQARAPHPLPEYTKPAAPIPLPEREARSEKRKKSESKKIPE